MEKLGILRAELKALTKVVRRVGLMVAALADMLVQKKAEMKEYKRVVLMAVLRAPRKVEMTASMRVEK